MKIKKIVIHCTTNTNGTDSWEFVEVYEDTPDDELDELAQEYAISNAEMYGIYPPSYDDEEDTEGDENIGGSWYVYDPKLHDMHTTNGIPKWHKL